MQKNRCVPLPWLALLATLPWLCGCAGWSIHNESRAALATQARQEYADAKVTEVAQAEQANLDYLLGEELKVVQDNSALQSDFAALAIASNEGPIADVLAEGRQRLRQLGFQDVKELRSYFNNDLRSARIRNTVESAAKVLRAKRIATPDCEDLPSSPPDLPDEDAKTAYRLYVSKCRDLIEAAKPPATGYIGRAHAEWLDARSKLATQQQDRLRALNDVRDAGKSYRDAAAQNAAPITAAAKANADLAEKEAKLATALDALRNLDLAGTFDDSIGALVEVLSATASGSPDPADPDLARATVVLKAIPALHTAAAELQASRDPIPVSGLLLELQRQTILADTAAKLQQLQEQRIAILRAKFEGYRTEAQRWLAVSDALCNYAAGSHAGLKCSLFETEIGDDGAVTCRLGQQELANCVLDQSWKERLVAQDSPTLKRELYKAAASYLQAIAAQSLPIQEIYREIDVRHRETLLARRSAIDGWNSIVSVPLDQLKAYYDGGIKPAELADLIVKALGFTAIAVGASQ